MTKKTFGYELVLDLHGCDPGQFTRVKLTSYFKRLCEKIDMERGPLYFWDYAGDEEALADAPDHLAGTSAVQFIYTSNITVHALDRLGTVYINIFSCKKFSVAQARRFSEYFFGAEKFVEHFIRRP